MSLLEGLVTSIFNTSNLLEKIFGSSDHMHSTTSKMVYYFAQKVNGEALGLNCFWICFM